MKTGSVVDAQRSRKSRSGRQRKTFGFKKRYTHWKSRKIHTVRLAAELEISRSSIQQMLRKDIKEVLNLNFLNLFINRESFLL